MHFTAVLVGSSRGTEISKRRCTSPYHLNPALALCKGFNDDDSLKLIAELSLVWKGGKKSNHLADRIHLLKGMLIVFEFLIRIMRKVISKLYSMLYPKS